MWPRWLRPPGPHRALGVPRCLLRPHDALISIRITPPPRTTAPEHPDLRKNGRPCSSETSPPFPGILWILLRPQRPCVGRTLEGATLPFSSGSFGLRRNSLPFTICRLAPIPSRSGVESLDAGRVEVSLGVGVSPSPPNRGHLPAFSSPPSPIAEQLGPGAAAHQRTGCGLRQDHHHLTHSLWTGQQDPQQRDPCLFWVEVSGLALFFGKEMAGGAMSPGPSSATRSQ